MSVREQIQAAGVRNGQDYFQPGAREAPDAIPCRGCGALVLTGLDAEVAGIPVVVDVDPVDPIGEFQALMAGRETFAYVRRGHKQVIRGPRSAGQIGLNPASTCSVLVSHACGGQVFGRPVPPRPPDPPSFLDTPLTPCEVCGNLTASSVCSTCRQARPAQITGRRMGAYADWAAGALWLEPGWVTDPDECRIDYLGWCSDRRLKPEPRSKQRAAIKAAGGTVKGTGENLRYLDVRLAPEGVEASPDLVVRALHGLHSAGLLTDLPELVAAGVALTKETP